MVDDIKQMCKEARRITVMIGIAAIAGDTEKELPVFKAPCSGWITKVGIIPQAAITGAATDHFKVAFIDKGAAGVGTDEIASKTYDNGIDEIAFDFADFGALSNAKLAKDETVTFAKTTPGTGMNMPDLIAVIEFLPDQGDWN